MIEIRPLVEADMEAYWHIRLEALELDADAFGSSPEEHRKKTPADIATQRLGEESFILGAFDGDKIVGTVGLYREPGAKARHKTFVWGVYVKASHRGQSISRKLLTAAIEIAKTYDGLERVTLTQSGGNGVARNLYLSLGFVPYGVEPEAMKVGDRYIDEELLSLRLR